MGRRRWRERRAPRNPLAASFDFDPWRPGVVFDPPRLVEHNTRVLEAFKAVGIRGADVAAPRLLCGADLGDGLTCRIPAGPLHKHSHLSRTIEQERAETERSLNAGTSQMGGLTPDFVILDEALQYQTEDDRVIAEGLDQVIQADLKKAFDELPAVSNPAPGLWEIVTGKPLPSYTELLERGRRAEHPTYDLLNVQSTRAPELSSAEACDRLTAAIERPRLAARITEVLPPALASQLALAVEEAVRRGIRAHVEAEKAVLNQLAEGATARLQQSIEDQKRGREANAERWTTPSRLS